MNDKGKYLAMTVDEFMEAYRVNRNRVYDEIKKGRLHARKLGRRTMIAADDAETWFRSLPSLAASHAA